jgi:hypothetical protein
MVMLEGGGFGGEYSGRWTQPVSALWGARRSKDETKTTANVNGWIAMVFVLMTASLIVFWAFLQQSCDAGISIICPHWFCIMRQQARSSVVISASGAMHAMAGATQDTSNSKIAPNCRKVFIFRSIRFLPKSHNFQQLIKGSDPPVIAMLGDDHPTQRHHLA